MRRKTALMMYHVDKMLAAYKALCYESERLDEKNRWDALYLLKIDRRTYFRYINYAIEDLAVLLFSIEAIGTWSLRKLQSQELKKLLEHILSLFRSYIRIYA